MALRIITIVSDGEYPEVSQQSMWSGYGDGVESNTMKVAEDLRFFIEKKKKVQP